MRSAVYQPPMPLLLNRKKSRQDEESMAHLNNNGSFYCLYGEFRIMTNGRNESATSSRLRDRDLGCGRPELSDLDRA